VIAKGWRKSIYGFLLILGLPLFFACYLHASEVEMGSFIMLHTLKGETITGRIVEVSEKAVHLVGPKINQWVSLDVLTEASQETLKPMCASTYLQYSGMEKLVERVHQLQNQRSWYEIYPVEISPPLYDGVVCNGYPFSAKNPSRHFNYFIQTRF